MVYKEKECKHCNIKYVPCNPNQKFCTCCKDVAKREREKKQWKVRSRKRKGYNEYTRNCLICTKEFNTYYTKKVYCGSDLCEKERKRRNSASVEINRGNRSAERKVYYNKNRERLLTDKAIRYREDNPEAKPYKQGRVYRHTIEYIKSYIEDRGYKLISQNYKNNRSKLVLLCPDGHEWKTSFHGFEDVGNTQGNRCRQCYVNNNYTSSLEKSVRDFFDKEYPDVECLYNDRIQIKPYEIDLYFPVQKVGVELCGLYWHSEVRGGTDRKYHYDKMIMCRDKGIRLITVFEDELNNNFDIVISRIVQALGLTRERIYARKCTVSEIDKKEANKFFNSNHIQGKSTTLKAWGLVYKDRLVSVCSVGKVIRKHTSTEDTLELKRFCTLPGVTVVGGVDKLFSRVKRYALDNGYSCIKSYCDMRYGNIFKPVYEVLGFVLQGATKYTPHYCKSGVRYRNFSLRKTPEERLTGKTEFQLRLDQGYDRIWDCGHRTYVYELD